MWAVVAAVALVTGVAALALPEHEPGPKPYIALGMVSLVIAAASALAWYFLKVAVERFERLDSGVDELARWTIDPAAWRRFAAANYSSAIDRTL